MDETLITYNNVEIHQQELCVLSDVTLQLHKGEFVYLVGKVGSGKTSLLKTFYGELDIADGEAEVLGYNMRTIKRKYIPQLRRKLGIVFQDFQLLTDRTVYNNLEFVLKATGWKNKMEIKERIEEVLQLVGMSNKGYKLPNELSGGEQQMLAMGRALMSNASMLMLDEPSMGLSPLLVQEIFDIIRDIHKAGMTILLVEQNAQMALSVADRAYVLETGHVVMDGTGAELLTNERVRNAYLGG